MLLSGCSTTDSYRPIILTNSQFTCLEPPPVPSDVDITTKVGQVQTGHYIVGMELVVNDCKAQLFEVRDVLQVQGATITDTIVEEKKPKFLGIF